MATNRRMKVIAEPVGPSFLPGLAIYANNVTAGNGEAHTIVFPAKSILAILTQSAEDTDAAKVVATYSITGNLATVTMTKTGAGVYHYVIFASVTETVAQQTVTSAEVLNPVQ